MNNALATRPVSLIDLMTESRDERQDRLLIFFMGGWAGLMSLSAKEAKRLGKSPEEAGYALAFAVGAQMEGERGMNTHDDDLIRRGIRGDVTAMTDTDLLGFTAAYRDATSDPFWPQDDRAGDAIRLELAEAEVRRRGLFDDYEAAYVAFRDEVRRTVRKRLN